MDCRSSDKPNSPKPERARDDPRAPMVLVHRAHRVLVYDFHPPDDLRLYAFEHASVLRSDDEVLVVEADHHGTLLRHYVFRDHWFKVNCTTDPLGTFVEEQPSGTLIPFSFNCDIATPMLRRGNAVFTVDLWIDVIVRSDGVRYQVIDRNQFAAAVDHGWLSEREAQGAETGLRELINLIEQNRLVSFLSAVHPFHPSTRPPAPPMQRTDPARFPILHPRQRPTWKRINETIPANRV